MGGFDCMKSKGWGGGVLCYIYYGKRVMVIYCLSETYVLLLMTRSIPAEANRSRS